MFNLKSTAVATRCYMKKHEPGILVGAGIVLIAAGIGTTVYYTIKATKIVEEAKKEQDQFTKKDTIKLTWKFYILPVISFGGGIACVLLSHSAHEKRAAAMGAAYALSEANYRNYREATQQIVGREKEEEIRKESTQKRMESAPIPTSQVIVCEKGNTLCFDPWSGRYFKSDRETIRRIVNDLNKRLINDMYISLNDFYYEVNLEETKAGEELGWSISRKMIDCNNLFDAGLSSDGTPCLVVNLNATPRYYEGD